MLTRCRTFDALTAISRYFGVEMSMLDMKNMDDTEDMVKGIIDESRKEVDTKSV